MNVAVYHPCSYRNKIVPPLRRISADLPSSKLIQSKLPELSFCAVDHPNRLLDDDYYVDDDYYESVKN